MPQVDPLEEYANPGFSPQQGSTIPNVGAPPAGPSGLALPVAQPSQGGLPFPASAQRQSNLLTLSGQPAPLEQMIQQHLQAMQAYSGAGYWDKFLNRGGVGSRAYEAQQQLPELGKLANTRSQERQLQEKYQSNIPKHLQEYAALLPEQQIAQRPLYHALITAQSQLAGLNAPPEYITHALTTSDLAKRYASILNDTLIDKDQAISRLSGVKPGKDSEDALGQIQTEAGQNALAMVQQYLPQAIIQFGGSSTKPLAMDDFIAKLQADPQLGDALKGSRTLRNTLQGWLNDPKNAEPQSAMGLIPGKVNLESLLEKAKVQAQGPKLSTEMNDILFTYRGPDGKPLTPATAALLPDGSGVTGADGKPVTYLAADQRTRVPAVTATQVARAAQQQADANKLALSERQGLQAMTAKNEFDRNKTLYELDPTTHWINKDTLQPVNRMRVSLGEVIKNGGEDSFAALKGPDHEAFKANQMIQGSLSQLVPIVKELTKRPGANLADGVRYWGETKLGIPNPAQALQAYQDLKIQWSKAISGSARITNAEMTSVGGLIPTGSDTAQLALRKLELFEQQRKNIENVLIGKMTHVDLQASIDKARDEIVRAAPVPAHMKRVQGTDGTVYVVPKGQSLNPGQREIK